MRCAVARVQKRTKRDLKNERKGTQWLEKDDDKGIKGVPSADSSPNKHNSWPRSVSGAP
jgi:hypothetical protein